MPIFSPKPNLRIKAIAVIFLLSCSASTVYASEKIWTKADLTPKAPKKSQLSTAEKITKSVSGFIDEISYHERRYKKLYKANAAHKVYSKEQTLIYYSLFRTAPEYSDENPNLKNALKESLEGAVASKLEKNIYLKSLLSGFSLEIDPLAWGNKSTTDRPIKYTVEPDYYRQDEPAPAQANMELDHYAVEGAGKLRPVYRVVPVFTSQEIVYENSSAKTSEQNDLITEHNKHIDNIDMIDTLLTQLNIDKKNLAKFKTKIVPVRSATGYSYTVELQQAAGLYKQTKNSNESDTHHYYNLPVTKNNVISHQSKGNTISKSSISVHHEVYVPGRLTLTLDHISDLSSAIYTVRKGKNTYTIKSSFDNIIDLNKVECIFSTYL